jgi:hypothetical protein
MPSIAEQIKATLEELTALEHAKARHEQVTESLAIQNIRWQEMDKQLDKELKDIKELEKMGIKSLFHKVLGSQEEQLEKERQEYLSLNLKYKELVKSIEITEFELGILDKKIVGIEKVASKLERLKDIRGKEILRTNSPLKNDLLVIIKKEEKAIRLIEEIKQAFDAGEQSLNSIRKVLKHLKNAEKWGQWDMYNNKSNYYDHMKYTAIDKAVDEAYRTKHVLSIYKNELADVGFSNTFTFNVESFTKFTDIFFDNLISDWLVQRKIKNVFSNVNAVFDKVTTIQESLQIDFKNIGADLEALDVKKDKLLTQ